MTADILRLILEAVMSGTLIVTLVTLRSTRKKASEEARAIEIDNSQKLLSNFQQFIVEPLKKEVNALRKDVRRLNRAVDKGDNERTTHHGSCVILSSLSPLTQPPSVPCWIATVPTKSSSANSKPATAPA